MMLFQKKYVLVLDVADKMQRWELVDISLKLKRMVLTVVFDHCSLGYPDGVDLKAFMAILENGFKEFNSLNFAHRRSPT